MAPPTAVSRSDSQQSFPWFDLLATELLQEIAIAAVHSTDPTTRPTYTKGENICFPYTALLISKKWRQLALTTPEMWNVINIRTDNKAYSLSTKLSRHIALSKTLPIHLHVRIFEVNMSLIPHIRGYLSNSTKCRSFCLEGTWTKGVALRSWLQSFFQPGDVWLRGIQELEITAFYVAERRLLLSSIGERLPELKRLSLSLATDSADTSEDEVRLPKLQELYLRVATLKEVHWMKNAEMPILETLEISCRNRGSAAFELSTSRKETSYFDLPSVQYAALRGVNAQERGVLLAGLPRVRCLVVELDMVLPMPGYRGSSAKLCPDLTRLIIFDPSSPSHSNSSEEPSIT